MKKTTLATLLVTFFAITNAFSQKVVANYKKDFDTKNNTDKASAWKYYWNAPQGWEAGSSTGDLNTGTILDRSSYTLLKATGSMLTADGDRNFKNSQPDSFVQLTKRTGHPGTPAKTPQKYAMDRYAIASYTVGKNGSYKIDNSTLTRVDYTKGNGLRVFVLVNDEQEPKFHKLLCHKQVGDGSFDVELGKLKKGDKIYVAIGANSDSAFDAFFMNFDVVKN